MRITHPDGLGKENTVVASFHVFGAIAMGIAGAAVQGLRNLPERIAGKLG